MKSEEGLNLGGFTEVVCFLGSLVFNCIALPYRNGDLLIGIVIKGSLVTKGHHVRDIVPISHGA